ncbi:MAG: hypothetical protein AAB594_01850 [Patescibacteria group bacterium]
MSAKGGFVDEERQYVDPEKIRQMTREAAERTLERWDKLPWWRKVISYVRGSWHWMWYRIFR